MTEEGSVISYDKDETLQHDNDNATVMPSEDGIGCVYGKLVLLG